MRIKSDLGPAFDHEWQARFQRFGRNYVTEHAVSGWSAEGLGRRCRLFQKLFEDLSLGTSARVLELGCGAGTYVRYLAGRGHQVVGVDYAMPSLQRAVESDPVRAGQYVVADGYALPFGRDSFDLVVCIGVLQTLGRAESLLEEITRVLRPRGVTVIETLNALCSSALMKRLHEIVGNRPPRLRFYSPSQVRRSLGRRELQVLRRVAVYLPPRRLPSLGRLLDRPATIDLLESVPGAALLGAHAFWWVGRKASGGR